MLIIKQIDDIKIGDTCKVMYTGNTIASHVDEINEFYNKTCIIKSIDYNNSGLKFLLLELNNNNYNSWWVPIFNVLFENNTIPIELSKLKKGLKLIVGHDYTSRYLDYGFRDNITEVKYNTVVEVIDYMIYNKSHNEIVVKCKMPSGVLTWIPISNLYENIPSYKPRRLIYG